MSDVMQGLTAKQKKFADYYVETGELAESAIRAGYSERSAYNIGSENIRKPQIKAYIEMRMRKLEKPTIASADEVLQYLTSVMRGEEVEPQLKRTPTGAEEVVYTTPKIADRTRSADLLAKRYGVYVDKIADININQPIIIEGSEDLE